MVGVLFRYAFNSRVCCADAFLHSFEVNAYASDTG
ncbi:hypothetical protein PF007_g31369 [Phytophthora fragariae]|uniref:Uncharacterized protein n=1 Tax=Phytophthora fragariae TaxID=53985 RepID=A0A6A3PHC3_9STRA|nr:hypothetical protein PF007_g31369 [Phytophthora fragariae]KAE9266827.1 hypothetical protein PF008_g31516 [Phytophthora fragariae]